MRKNGINNALDMTISNLEIQKEVNSAKDSKSILKKYSEDFQKKTLLWNSILLAFFILFSIPLKWLTLKLLIKPLISYCPKNSIQVDVVFLILAISVSWFLFNKLKNVLLPTINSVAFWITVFIIYYCFYRNDVGLEFYHFLLFKKIAYSDVFIPCIAIIFSNYKSYNNNLSISPSKYSLLSDSPLEEYSDEFGYQGYALELSKYIDATSIDMSFAISIIGEWGSGKTDFMLRLEKILKDGKDNIVFKFNPWRVGNSDAIIEDFFQILSSQIRPYSRLLSTKIKEYSKRVLQNSKDAKHRLIDVLLQEIFATGGTEQNYTEINDSIKGSAKKIIVFIDDVDRLAGREVMEVLRLVRNTANFANTFFIIGVDQDYIVNVLRSTRDFSNEEQYLKKIFQLVVTLPAFKRGIFLEKLKEFLITEDLPQSEKDDINTALISLTNPSFITPNIFSTVPRINQIENLLDNMRDLKRFSNSFKIVYNIMKSEVEVSDLMILELIRNKNIQVYNNLRNRKFLKTGSQFYLYAFDEDAYEKFISDNQEYSKQPGLKDAVLYLLSDKKNKNSRKFIYTYNFYLYFSYQLFNLISLSAFNSTVEKDGQDIITQFESWITEGKEPELKRICDSFINFRNKGFLMKMTKVYYGIKVNHETWKQYAEQLVFNNRDGNLKSYFNNNVEENKIFIDELLSDDSISLIDRADLAFLYVDRQIRIGREEDPGLVYDKKNWEKKIYKLFHQYLKGNPRDINEIIDFFRATFYEIKNDFYFAYLPACRLLENYILADEFIFIQLIRNAIKPSPSSDRGYYIIYWPVKSIFINYLRFKKYLVEFNCQDGDDLNLKRIVLQYIDQFYNNNERPFRIEDSLDNDFIKRVVPELR